MKLRPRLTEYYLRLLIACGAGAVAFSVSRLSVDRLDGRFLLLAAVTLCIGSRITVKIPRLSSHISISDTFILLTILLCGGEEAVLLAALDGFCSTLHISRKTKTFLLNASVTALSTFVTVWVLRFLFGPVENHVQNGGSASFLIALCVMGVVQYVVNFGLVVVGVALKTGEPILRTWRRHYLWTSVTYFAGASATGIITMLVGLIGFTAFIVVMPIVAIVYFTYQTYLKNIESTERHVAELQESEERFRSAFDYAAIGMALVSPEGKWLQVNRSLCEMVGYSEHELLGMSWESITHADDLSTVRTQVEQLLDGRIPTYQTEKRYIHKNGGEVWIFLSISLTRDLETKSTRLIFQTQDITDRKRAERQLLHDAFHDTLTGLPNRALFVDRLKQALARTRRLGPHQFAVLFLDLDRFKVINDSLGHIVGDQLLVGIARRLEACLRPGDTVARLGGDEFTILLEGVTDIGEAIRVAERVEKELSSPFNLMGHEVFTTVSIGIAPSTTGYDSPAEILRDADTAMYRAKSLGKARHEIFDKTMHARAVSLMQLENDLRRAVERQEFLLYYQPIVSLETGEICGVEALMRWQHPEHGLIAPAAFIPVAEETGLILQMGQWGLREACRQLREWQRQFAIGNAFQVSVNLSSKQFSQPDLIEQITCALRDTGLDPSGLRLEITESVVMENIESATDMLRQLRDLGVEASIDDFGTGYSSLSYLHRFPITILKIDRSFVSGMSNQTENVEIIRSIVMLARNLGMTVVAEGVETEEQVAQLRELGCKHAQGYLFSRPARAEDAAQFLSKPRLYSPPPPPSEILILGEDSRVA
ncbi:MAG TPA: EAL domain-containing protein [Pyrinomonadaceae bacterium]|nr:EAL domain-containing protein [Pyrinomonadaceae bacterium]